MALVAQPGPPPNSFWVRCNAVCRASKPIGFFIEDKLLRLVFDTAALRRRGDECSNNLEMHPFKAGEPFRDCSIPSASLMTGHGDDQVRARRVPASASDKC